MRVCGFFLLTSSTGCLRPPSEDEQPINTSPPEGGEHGPQLRPSFGGLRGLRPCLFPTPTSGAGPLQAMPAASWSRLWRSLRPCGREIPAYQGAQLAAVWVGTSRPASWACRGATAAGNAMAKHGARVARRRDCAAFGCGVHRAPAVRVQRLRPLLAGRQIGRGAAVVRSGHGGEGLPSRGSGGATPCRGAALGGGRDAGIGGFRAQRLTKRFRWLAIET